VFTVTQVAFCHPLTRPSGTERRQRYVAVGVINVYIGVVEVNGVYERVPMVARVLRVLAAEPQRLTLYYSRVSMADYRGSVLLDTFVRPT